jgi:DAACS family dicarboxylate/amino acid:cation (Na+ or H+) symporter
MAESIGGTGKGMKLHTKILLGLLIGAILGITANQTLGGAHPTVVWINTYLAGPVGQIFLRMLFMVVIPLVFASISLGVAGLGDLKRVGRVGTKAITYFLLSTALAATLGLIAVAIIRPGESLDPATRENLMQTYAGDASSRVEVAAQQDFGINTLVSIVTRNPVKSAVDLDLLGIIFFALMFGAALTQLPADKAKPMLGFLQALEGIVIKIVHFAMMLAPYGVLGLIFGVTSRFGFHLLKPLATYIVVVLGALLVHVLVNISAILRFFVGIRPGLFFSRIRNALVTAFSTSSSSATLPAALAVARETLGIRPGTAGFVLPLGTTMNMSGTALFEGCVVLFVAQVFGIELTFAQQITLLLLSVLSAVAVAGIPGGALPLIAGLLATFGVPPEGIGIVLGVERLLDMTRTMVNVGSDVVTCAVVDEMVGKTEKA